MSLGDALPILRHVQEQWANRLHGNNLWLIQRHIDRERHVIVRFSMKGFSEEFCVRGGEGHEHTMLVGVVEE